MRRYAPIMNFSNKGNIFLSNHDPTVHERKRFEGAVVRAGTSTTITENTMCGSPVTKYQAIANNWMEFACNSPDGVIARYVSVDLPGTDKQLALCKVLVIPCDLPQGKATVITHRLEYLERNIGRQNA